VTTVVANIQNLSLTAICKTWFRRPEGSNRRNYSLQSSCWSPLDWKIVYTSNTQRVS